MWTQTSPHSPEQKHPVNVKSELRVCNCADASLVQWSKKKYNLYLRSVVEWKFTVAENRNVLRYIPSLSSGLLLVINIVLLSSL